MWIRSLLLVLASCFSTAATSIAPFFPTDTELNILPAYCKARAEDWGSNKYDPRVKPWIKVFGSNFSLLHHYCEGLVRIIRGDRSVRDPRIAKGHYARAIPEFAYVERGATANFKLWPELLVKKGDAYNRLGDLINAEKLYLKAFNKYPKYSVSYKRLVDLYITQKRVKEAKNINNLALERFGLKKSFVARDKAIRKL